MCVTYIGKLDFVNCEVYELKIYTKLPKLKMYFMYILIHKFHNSQNPIICDAHPPGTDSLEIAIFLVS